MCRIQRARTSLRESQQHVIPSRADGEGPRARICVIQESPAKFELHAQGDAEALELCEVSAPPDGGGPVCAARDDKPRGFEPCSG
jgi:hypothetical protein